MKNIHTPSVIAGAFAASVLIFLGLNFPISMDLLVGYSAVVVLLALVTLEYTPSRKRLQVK
jgi:hypothetical protein